MNDHITEVNQYPPIRSGAFDTPPDLSLFSEIVSQVIGQRLQHPVACPCAKNKIISKIGNLTNINQQDVFPLFLF